MRYYFLLLLVGLLARCTAPAPVANSLTPQQLDEQQLRYLKTVEWPQAYREQDTVLLQRLLADEFRVIDAEGHWSSKPEELAYIRQHRTAHTSFHYTIQRLQVFEGQTALLAGYGTASGLDARGAYAFTYQSSNFFVKRQGRWQAVASHVSGIRKVDTSEASTGPAFRAMNTAHRTPLVGNLLQH